MLYENGKNKNGHQPSRLQDCYLDFILSRQAMLCTPRTMKFYRDTLEKFLEWLEKEGVIEVDPKTWTKNQHCLGGVQFRNR